MPIEALCIILWLSMRSNNLKTCFDFEIWPLTSTFYMDITFFNDDYSWKFHDDTMSQICDRQTDWPGQTDRWIDRGVHREISLAKPPCDQIVLVHDDVIKWKQFPRYWPFMRGIHRSPKNSPHKGQGRGALMFSVICAWINGWVNNRQADDLISHRAHYDFIVMDILVTPVQNVDHFVHTSMCWVTPHMHKTYARTNMVGRYHGPGWSWKH